MSLQLSLSRITADNTIAKGYALQGTTLQKISGGVLYNGQLDVLALDNLQDFASVISRLTPHQALVLGAPRDGRRQVPIATRTAIESGQACAGAIARSLEHLGWAQGGGFGFLDHDGDLPPEQLLKIATKAVPEFADVEILAVPSSSHGIAREGDGQLLRAQAGWHLYFGCELGSDVGLLKSLLAQALPPKIERSKSGARLVRYDFDLSVFSPERLDFAGQTVLGAGLLKIAPRPFILQAGGLLKLSRGGNLFATCALSTTQTQTQTPAPAPATPVVPVAPVETVTREEESQESHEAEEWLDSEHRGNLVSIFSKINRQILGKLTDNEFKQVQELLRFIPSATGAIDYQNWLGVGQALRNTFSFDLAQKLFIWWSQLSPDCDLEKDLIRKFNSLRKAKGGQGFGLAKLYRIAERYGFKCTDATPPANLQAWRPAENPHEPVATGQTEDVRKDLQTALQKTVDDYLDFLKDANVKSFEPVLFMPTTGTGKTTAAKALIRNVELRMAGARVCVFVPDHAQADEYEQAGFFHFWGRNPDPQHPGYCPNHEKMQEAMQKNHVSQAEFCRNCSNGHRWAMGYYYHEPEKVEKARALLLSRGLNPENVTPCVWQTHLREALEELYVVGVSKSYSHSLTRGALTIFDEHFETGKGINVTLQDIDHWSKRNGHIIERLEKSIALQPESQEFQAVQANLERHQQAAYFFQAIAQKMAGYVGKTGSVNVDPELLQSVQGLLEAAKKESKQDIAVADWETLKFNAAGELIDNPLRAASSIAESLKFGDGFVQDGQLVVAESLPVMERLKTGLPTVILDATPDPVIADIVKAKNGKIINAIAHQNVKIVRYPNRFWGLTPLNVKRSGAERRDRELNKYKALKEYHQGSVLLLHKRAVDALDPDHANSDLGHWGKHHRAHNAWSGRDTVIVGSFFVPIDVMRSEYQCSRVAALAAGANPENWPAWPDDLKMVKDLWICEGSHEVQSRLPLPENEQIRNWYLARITAETVQAIGRPRGANSQEVINVSSYGGVPLHGLWEHGLRVAEYLDDPVELGKTKSQHMADMANEREASLNRCDSLASRLIAKGQTVTRDAMQNEVEAINAALDEAANQGKNDLYGDGNNIYTTPVQMPHPEVFKAWLESRAPALAMHLSTKGRNAGIVKTMQEAAKKFGAELVKAALDFAQKILTNGFSQSEIADIARQTLAGTYGNRVEMLAAELILIALADAEVITKKTG